MIVAPVAPAAQPLNPDEIRAVALQSGPPANATREQQASLQRIAERLRHKDRAQAQTDWAFLVERAARTDKKHKDWIELESWSNYVLHQAYVAPDADLNRAADKVRSGSNVNDVIAAIDAAADETVKSIELKSEQAIDRLEQIDEISLKTEQNRRNRIRMRLDEMRQAITEAQADATANVRAHAEGRAAN